MITSQQFDDALKTISDYKSQLEKGLIVSVQKPILIDIQNKISRNTFYTLQHYFEDHVKQTLEWNDLKAMDFEILQNIDFMKLRRYRGFGIMAENRLTDMINTFSVNSEN
jgi:hypothetical protein